MQETRQTRVRSLGQENPWRRKWQPAPVFLPGESHDRGAWRATVHGVAKELDTTERMCTHTHTHTHAHAHAHKHLGLGKGRTHWDAVRFEGGVSLEFFLPKQFSGASRD